LEEKTNQANALRIENNNKDNRLQIVQQELTRTQTERDERITATDLQELLSEIESKVREISTLRGQLGQSRESLFHLLK